MMAAQGSPKPDNVVYPAGWGSRRPSATAREALLAALDADRDLADRFASACREDALAVRDLTLEARSALRMRGHNFATHGEQFEEVGETLFGLASELLPDLPAAAPRGALRQRVAAREHREDVEHFPAEAIEALAASEYAAFDLLVLAARGGDAAMLHAARHLWQMLRERGQRHEPQGFSRHVRVVLAAVFPEPEVEETMQQPADGGWDDELAYEVARKALAYAADHTRGIPREAMDRAEADRAEEEMDAATEAGDLEDYKRAARHWASSWRRAAERVCDQAQEEEGQGA